jgi:dTDP-4-dehydrorhamnose reductase
LKRYCRPQSGRLSGSRSTTGSLGRSIFWIPDSDPYNERVKKVAVFGGAGQLGQELRVEFAARGYVVEAFDRSNVDITDAARVEQALAEFDPGLVLNAAAYNQVDIAEKEAVTALQVNALAVRNLAMACRQTDAKLVHFSTDYVFDGMAGRAYREDDETHPLGAYAVSKLAGELYARAYLDRALIVRTSGVYGPAGMGTARGNFVEMMLRLAANGQPIRVVEDHVASPTYAPALASRTADLVDSGASGIYHLGGGEPISWFDWAGKIFSAAGLNPQLKATTEREFRTPARRPKFSALSNAKAMALGIAPMPSLDEAIRIYLKVRAEKLAGR